MNQNKLFLAVMLITAFLAAACSPATETEIPAQDVPVLTVMTHDSFSISEELVEEFQAENGVEIRFLKSGDTGTTVNKAILAKENLLQMSFTELITPSSAEPLKMKFSIHTHHLGYPKLMMISSWIHSTMFCQWIMVMSA